MARPPEKLWQLVLLCVAFAGCKPKIGDDCKISTDCSAAADRLCDITEPGGYCTVYNCEPGTCPPDESLCVEFGAQRSPVPECTDLQSPSPYGRAFCLATCSHDSDCRDGYRCRDLSQPNNRFGALLIDTDRGHKACVVDPVTTGVVQGTGDDFGGVCHATLPPASGGSASGGSSAGGSASGGSSVGGGDASGAAGDASGGEPAQGGAGG